MKILDSYKPNSKRLQKDLSNFYSTTYQKEPLIFLLRHGQIKGYDTKRFIGNTDVSLDHTGIEQALLWKESFASIHFNTVYSSSLQRCLYTAQTICPNQKIKTDHRINEINMGDWDGNTFAQIKKLKPEEFKKRGEQIFQFKPPNGESFKDLSDRVLPFFRELIDNQEHPNIKKTPDTPPNILIVTHAGVIRVLFCHLLGMNSDDLFKIKLGYAQLSVMKR
jgi:probable phosphoglycerate mutase